MIGGGAGESLPGLLRRIRIGGLARSAGVVLGWNVARLGSQLIWVVLLARALGAEGYGGFSGIAGLALALSGLVGVGLGLRMYQDVAREPGEFPRRWAQAARALAWSAGLLGGVFILVAHAVFPEVPWQLISAVALAEVMLAPMVTQAAFAYAAHGQMSRAAAAPVVLSVARVLAVLVLFAVVQHKSLVAYAWLHLAATAIAAVLVWLSCRNNLLKTLGDPALSWTDIRAGIGFSSVWASGQAFGSFDKAIVLRLGGADPAGQYTVAQRFANLVALPVDALTTAVMPRLFRAGAGLATHPRLIAWLSLAVVSYGALGAFAVWICGGWLPRILGPEFSAAVPALNIMAFYLPAYCMRILGANILLGFGWKRWRFGCDVAAMSLLAALMAWWVPKAGVVGAAWSLLSTEVFLATLIWLRVGFGGHRGRIE